MIDFIKNYFAEYGKLVSTSDELIHQLIELKKLWSDCSQNGNKVILVGNGGSAAMASHVAVDLTKNAGVRAINFNEADLITCLANDFGHENWMREALRLYSDPGDTVVLISSSGCSPNVVNAAKWCVTHGREVVTFTGMDLDNPLRTVNPHGLNFLADSRAYNLIEMAHHFWLLCVVDLMIGKMEYSASPDGT